MTSIVLKRTFAMRRKMLHMNDVQLQRNALMSMMNDSSKSASLTRAAREELAKRLFQDVYSQYQKPVSDFLYRMTRDLEWAADLTQDTFLKVYAHRDSLNSIQNIRAWVFRIAVNTAKSSIRRKHKFTWLSLADIQPNSSVEPAQYPAIIAISGEDTAKSVIEKDEIVNALAELSQSARAVILLRATAGFDIDEIASMLGISEANTRKILYRAKEKLRDTLQPENPED